MLKKLYTHDFSTQERIHIPLMAGQLVAALLNCLLYFLMEAVSTAYWDLSGALVEWGTIGVYGIVSLAGYALRVAPFLYCLYYCAKNLYGDEGYLTLVLPLSAHQQLLGKYLSCLCWVCINVVVTFVSDLISSGIPALVNYLQFGYDASEIGAYLTEWLDPFTILDSFLSPALYLMLGLCAVTFGCLLCRRHRVMGTLLCILAISFALSLLQIIPSLLALETDLTWLADILQYLISLGAGVGAYFATHYMLNHRLDLE